MRRQLSITGARAAAFDVAGCTCELHRAEVVALDLSSYDRATGTLTIHDRRRKVHAVLFDAGTGEALEDWLALRGHLDNVCPRR